MPARPYVPESGTPGGRLRGRRIETGEEAGQFVAALAHDERCGSTTGCARLVKELDTVVHSFSICVIECGEVGALKQVYRPVGLDWAPADREAGLEVAQEVEIAVQHGDLKSMKGGGAICGMQANRAFARKPQLIRRALPAKQGPVIQRGKNPQFVVEQVNLGLQTVPCLVGNRQRTSCLQVLDPVLVTPSRPMRSICGVGISTPPWTPISE